MGASKGEPMQKVVIKDIDINKIPMENITNRELYLIELYTKKKQITDKHVDEGIKPTEEDNMGMARLNIEINEQMEKIFRFHSKKRKKPKTKIILDPLLPVYKYSKLKKDLEILTWQWEELNGEHEEYKNMMDEKRKQERIIKDRKLHREDPFYPDEESEEEDDKENENNKINEFEDREENEEKEKEGEEYEN